MPEPPALRVRNLTVRYGSLCALADVSWSVADGEILGVIGPNGAGKSTCFAAVTNAVPHSGTAELYGAGINGVTPQRLARRGLRRTFQRNAFFAALTVLENAMAALQAERGLGLLASIAAPWSEARRRGELRAMAAALLAEFGVPARYHGLRPDELPYGLQRMLSVVLAYGGGARVLLIDEPAAGVGGDDMRALVDLLTELRARGVAMVLIEHHMDLVMEIVDRLAVLDRGQRIAYAAPRDVQRDPAVLEAYLGQST